MGTSDWARGRAPGRAAAGAGSGFFRFLRRAHGAPSRAGRGGPPGPLLSGHARLRGPPGPFRGGNSRRGDGVSSGSRNVGLTGRFGCREERPGGPAGRERAKERLGVASRRRAPPAAISVPQGLYGAWDGAGSTVTDAAPKLSAQPRPVAGRRALTARAGTGHPGGRLCRGGAPGGRSGAEGVRLRIASCGCGAEAARSGVFWRRRPRRGVCPDQKAAGLHPPAGGPAGPRNPARTPGLRHAHEEWGVALHRAPRPGVVREGPGGDPRVESPARSASGGGLPGRRAGNRRVRPDPAIRVYPVPGALRWRLPPRLAPGRASGSANRPDPAIRRYAVPAARPLGRGRSVRRGGASQ